MDACVGADTVTGFTWESNTRLNFTTARGDIVSIYDGKANLHRFRMDPYAEFDMTYQRFFLCESNVRCSAFDAVLLNEQNVEEVCPT